MTEYLLLVEGGQPEITLHADQDADAIAAAWRALEEHRGAERVDVCRMAEPEPFAAVTRSWPHVDRAG